MLGYIAQRIASAISVILITMVFSFALFYLAPTDPAGAICGDRCPMARYQEIRISLHLDQPLPTQIGDYLKGLVAGRTYISGGESITCPAPCLGYSYALGQPVTTLMADALPVTVSIVVGSSLLYLVIGTRIGILAALRRGTWLDRLAVGTSLALGSMPYFVVALLVALYVTILPASGYRPLSQDPIGWARGMTAAWVTLGLYNCASYSRYARASMIESLGEEYIRTARAKGVGGRRLVYHHGLRGALTPLVTLFGLDLASALTGAVFTEAIFGLPGLGLLTLRAFNQFDLPVIMATVLIGATVLVLMNLLVDITYTVLDPRIRQHP